MKSNPIPLQQTILRRLVAGKDRPASDFSNGERRPEGDGSNAVSTAAATDDPSAAFERNTDLATRTNPPAVDPPFWKKLIEKDEVPEGERDDTLLRAACSFTQDMKRGRGRRVFDDADRVAELRRRVHDLNRSRCKPPLDDVTVDQKVDQAIKYAVEEGDAEVKPLEERHEVALERLDEILQSKSPGDFFTDGEILEAIAHLMLWEPARYAEIMTKIRGCRKTSIRELKAALKPILCDLRGGLGSAVSRASDYRIIDGCFFLVRDTQDGEAMMPLCNFTAEIIEQVTHDDGAEQRIVFRIEGCLASGQPLPTIEVPSEGFSVMNWPSIWGVAPIIYAGFAAKDHLRVAIQTGSVDVIRRTIYCYSGWVKIEGKWYFLHSDGAIGTVGTVSGIQVELQGELKHLTLPAPPTSEQLQSDFTAIQRLLELGPPHLTYPLLAAVCRAVIDSVDFSIHICGPTGVFKSELAALFQQFFGPSLDARHLPGNWSSTDNAIEGIAFTAKNALLVVDDFAPTGSKYDVQRYHQKADRIIRGSGNNSGRQRMRADGSLRPTRPPRALILSTGEDVPRGQSLRARMLVLEISPGDIPTDRLTVCQRDARDGAYSRVLAAFIQFLAPQLDQVRSDWRDKVSEMRSELQIGNSHARTPMLAAELAVALKCFLDFMGGNLK